METQNLESVLDTVSEKLKGMANTKTVVGEEFVLGDYTCKPVIKVGLGFGSGGGDGESPSRHKKGKGTGYGAGAGIGIQPIGFLASRGDEIKFIPANNKKGLDSFFEKVPNIMDKVFEMKKQQEKENKE